MYTLTHTHTHTHTQEGPRWCTLRHVKTGEILIGLKKVSAVREANEWLQLDEASRPFVEGIWSGFVQKQSLVISDTY